MRKHIQSTPGASDITNALKPIKVALASNLREFRVSLSGGGTIYFLPREHSKFDDIPALVHPVIFGSESTEPFCVMDLRHIRGRKPQPVISTIVRIFLTMEDTVEPEIASLYKIDYRFVGIVFVKLLSTVLTRTYGLNPDQQLDVEIHVADYYTCLLEEQVSKDRRKSFIRKLVKSGEKRIDEHLNKREEYAGIRDLTDAIANDDISPKLKKLNPGLLLTIVSGITYGTNIKPIIATSMEYPPYFNYLVYTVVHNIAYKNSLLVKVIEQSSKTNRDATQAYINASKSLSTQANDIYKKIEQFI